MSEALLINGRWREGTAAPRDSINPATGAVNASVSQASADDVDEAVTAAARAMRESNWRMRPPHERARCLYRFAEALEGATDTLAGIQMRENGKTIAECRAQVGAAAGIVRYFAGLTETMESAVHPPRGDFLSFDRYEPFGVVAAITPWNSPMTMTAQKMAPALGAGNAVIVKPSELTPLVVIEMARLALTAGIPDDCLQVLCGEASVGQALVGHEDVDLISFTGGTRTGRAIAAQAASRLCPTVLELGGKSANIVFADTDFDAAVAGVAFAIFSSGGQSCIAGSRLLIDEAIADRFLQALIECAQALTIGAPNDPATKIGPMASFEHRDGIEAAIAQARDDGGEVLTGGKRPEGEAYSEGAYFEPTIVAGLGNDHVLTREELFAPVLSVLRFTDEAEAVALANDNDYGLAAGIWSRDADRALRVGEQLEAGTIWINTYKQLSIAAPFGGYKQSGLGREKGPGGLRAYQQCKSYFLGRHPAPLPWARG